MSILVQDIVTRMQSRLDAEGSDRYLFDQDFKPAINSAMEWVVTALNEAFAQNKLTPESLRELVKVKIWQANTYSRISYSATDTGDELWSILGVYPEPAVNKQGGFANLSDKSESQFKKDISFLSSEKGAKRLTLEEWNDNVKNIFMPGNNIMQGQLKEYAYLDFADYTSTSYAAPPGKVEIEVRPSVASKLVAIAYLAYPKKVTVIGDSIPFPASVTELITDFALQNISEKQGDGTTLASFSQNNIAKLISLIV